MLSDALNKTLEASQPVHSTPLPRQAAPSVALMDKLPEIPVEAAVTLTPAIPLVEALNNPDEFAALTAIAARKPVAGTPKPIASVPTIYYHANRPLERVAPPAGVVHALTSHSFRRGAQHASGCHGLTHRWIFNRCAWNMSTTNKGFSYIFNTSREDHRVSKALCGYGAKAEMENAKHNLSQQVADVLTAYLILHYPRMKELQANGLVVQRMEAGAFNAGASNAELVACSSHLAACEKEQHKQTQDKTPPPLKKPSNESKAIEPQRSVIHQLLQHIKCLDGRMDNLDAKMDGVPPQDK
ncbi:unnamed protein product [Phytophthora fragariaefolia]|uniref:Unnamed protein product n=1 Tax=Phytophthora fragariaefolia TaxID=1490495 RepID=A0A9W7D9B2_9STRA|nr:unnamed protein product [Phytophthora fragariaefolia]